MQAREPIQIMAARAPLLQHSTTAAWLTQRRALARSQRLDEVTTVRADKVAARETEAVARLLSVASTG